MSFIGLSRAGPRKTKVEYFSDLTKGYVAQKRLACFPQKTFIYFDSFFERMHQSVFLLESKPKSLGSSIGGRG